MTSFFNTTTTIRFTTSLPASIPAPKAIATLHNHEAFIRCDPHMISFRLLPTTTTTAADASPPSSRASSSPPTPDPPMTYEVVDRIHALPAGLWDSDVVSTARIANLERGISVRMRSPMGITMEAVWEVREVEAEGGRKGLEMVEESVISCSRFLAGIVRGQCEANWEGIHERLVGIMKGGGAGPSCILELCEPLG